MILIPDDFPRETPLGSVPGIQPKIPVRLVEGRYIVGLTDEELLQRYEYCDDLVQQLVAYCRRKADEHPEWSHETTLGRMATGVARKGQSGEWDVTAEEQRWMVSQIKLLLGW
ncbi:hypothetical protein [Ferribacterium limneticum]|uniref:hypothetical protein n=1 Tax=Ferribacterium limneticum TaxID=76259 RepID=UPI001CF90186|nr:hypothetical protein [Ferribacterium limneticum]UCV22315.1 hypothetical protein KI613_17620 [Ferribacterium limneticum]